MLIRLFKLSTYLLIFLPACFIESINVSNYDCMFLFFSLYICIFLIFWEATVVCAYKYKICFMLLINCTFYYYEIKLSFV